MEIEKKIEEVESDSRKYIDYQKTLGIDQSVFE